MANKLDSVKIIPLGGVGEIGKNMTAVEYKNNIIIIDCGMGFPEDDMLGVDIVLPDITYLKRNKEKIRGIFLTHGHEDHIGGIPYLLKEISVPVYGSKLTNALLANKFKEHNLSTRNLKTINLGQTVPIGPFKVEFIRVTHSIPDSASININTKLGNIIFTGDYKIDHTPIDGDRMNLQRFAELGKEGVLCLLGDSTNAEVEGFSETEKKVGETLLNEFYKARDRVLVATFASNLHRIQQVITAAERTRRKVAVSGYSMINNIKVADELGYLDMRKDTIIELNDMKRYRDQEICILTTGSQGEPMSALTRMANKSHRQVQLKRSDTVIISATPVPGNEKVVSSVIDSLVKIGVNVIYGRSSDIHVSGHGYQEDLKMMLALTQPRFFMPVHGEYRMLNTHRELALSLGIDYRNIFILENGNTLEITKNRAKVVNTQHAGEVLVDGLGVGDVGNVVLRDRQHLSEDGILTIVVTIDKTTRENISGPDIISRGFVYMKENEHLIDDLTKIAEKALIDCKNKRINDWGEIKYRIRENVRKEVYRKTRRNPMILPVIMEV